MRRMREQTARHTPNPPMGTGTATATYEIPSEKVLGEL